MKIHRLFLLIRAASAAVRRNTCVASLKFPYFYVGYFLKFLLPDRKITLIIIIFSGYWNEKNEYPVGVIRLYSFIYLSLIIIFIYLVVN